MTVVEGRFWFRETAEEEARKAARGFTSVWVNLLPFFWDAFFFFFRGVDGGGGDGGDGGGAWSLSSSSSK